MTNEQCWIDACYLQVRAYTKRSEHKDYEDAEVVGDRATGSLGDFGKVSPSIERRSSEGDSSYPASEADEVHMPRFASDHHWDGRASGLNPMMSGRSTEDLSDTENVIFEA